jgi:hypothetical protein
MYYIAFYRSRLVPRWLSGWGIVGVVSMMLASVMALFSDNPVTGYTTLILPIAVQEMVLAFWLLFKGFDLSETGAIPTGDPSTSDDGFYSKGASGYPTGSLTPPGTLQLEPSAGLAGLEPKPSGL